MTMYGGGGGSGGGGRLWWLFVRGVREDGVVHHCLPCEDTMRKHVFPVTCVVPGVGDTAGPGLVFTVPGHGGTPG